MPLNDVANQRLAGTNYSVLQLKYRLERTPYGGDSLYHLDPGTLSELRRANGHA